MSEKDIFNTSHSSHNGIILVVILGVILFLCIVAIGIFQAIG